MEMERELAMEGQATAGDIFRVRNIKPKPNFCPALKLQLERRHRWRFNRKSQS
jgi:hypothetical protein